MDDFEITGIVKDYNGMISHCCVEGYGIQPVATIKRLIMEGACSFFISDEERKKNVYAQTYPNGKVFLTTDRYGFGMNRLNFLPLFDKPILRQIIESDR